MPTWTKAMEEWDFKKKEGNPEQTQYFRAYGEVNGKRTPVSYAGGLAAGLSIPDMPVAPSYRNYLAPTGAPGMARPGVEQGAPASVITTADLLADYARKSPAGALRAEQIMRNKAMGSPAERQWVNERFIAPAIEARTAQESVRRRQEERAHEIALKEAAPKVTQAGMTARTELTEAGKAERQQEQLKIRTEWKTMDNATKVRVVQEAGTNALTLEKYRMPMRYDIAKMQAEIALQGKANPAIAPMVAAMDAEVDKFEDLMGAWEELSKTRLVNDPLLQQQIVDTYANITKLQEQVTKAAATAPTAAPVTAPGPTPQAAPVPTAAPGLTPEQAAVVERETSRAMRRMDENQNGIPDSAETLAGHAGVVIAEAKALEKAGKTLDAKQRAALLKAQEYDKMYREKYRGLIGVE